MTDRTDLIVAELAEHMNCVRVNRVAQTVTFSCGISVTGGQFPHRIHMAQAVAAAFDTHDKIETTVEWGIWYTNDAEPEEWFDGDWDDPRQAAVDRMAEVRADIKRWGWDPADYEPIRLHRRTRTRTIHPDRVTDWEVAE